MPSRTVYVNAALEILFLVRKLLRTAFRLRLLRCTQARPREWALRWNIDGATLVGRRCAVG